MTDLKGMKLCVGVLVAQSFWLFIILFLGLLVIWNVRSSPSEMASWTLFGVFAAAFGTCIALSAIWRLLAHFIEEWWSIAAIARVKNWLRRPLTAASVIAGLLCLGYLWASVGKGLASSPGHLTQTLPIFLICITLGPPIAGSGLLTLLGLKRIATLNKSLKLFDASVPASSDENYSRIEASIRAEKGVGDTFARPEPKGFYLAGLTSKPWYESSEIDWVQDFENAYEEVLSEAKSIMSKLGNNIENYGYQGLNTDNWKKVSLVANRQENKDNLAACPVTASLLKKIPGYPVFRDAMFSILEPGGVITPHRDYGNLFLTMHFGLIIPDDGFMEVANMRRQWNPGRALIFDSSYNHQAVNNSDEPRIILLVDFLNPDMSETEREWVNRAPFWKP